MGPVHSGCASYPSRVRPHLNKRQKYSCLWESICYSRGQESRTASLCWSSVLFGASSQKLSDLGKALSYMAIPCSYLQHWDDGKSGHILTSREGLHLTNNIRCEKQLNPSRTFSTMFVWLVYSQFACCEILLHWAPSKVVDHSTIWNEVSVPNATASRVQTRYDWGWMKK